MNESVVFMAFTAINDAIECMPRSDTYYIRGGVFHHLYLEWAVSPDGFLRFLFFFFSRKDYIITSVHTTSVYNFEA